MLAQLCSQLGNNTTSEGSLKLFPGLLRALARDPVTRLSHATTVQWVAAKQSRNQSVGRDREIEKQKQQHPAINVAENPRQLHPRDVEPAGQRRHKAR